MLQVYLRGGENRKISATNNSNATVAIKEYFDSEQVNYNLYLAHFSPPLNRSQMQYISTTYLPSVNFFSPFSFFLLLRFHSLRGIRHLFMWASDGKKKPPEGQLCTT